MNGIPSTPDPFAFIQARSGSTRLSGKILERIPVERELTLLDHIYNRLVKLLPRERIVFLIPEDDEPLIQFLISAKYHFFAGSHENVRDRYIQAANKFSAEHIIRLTGDNPFVDLTSIELLWEAMFYINSPNYCLSMVGLPLGMGVECFSYYALVHKIDLYQENRHTEHVSLHIKENPQDNQIYRLTPPHLTDEDISLASRVRMTIDTLPDLELMRDVWKELGNTNPYFGAKEVIELYKTSPQIFLKNKDVDQISFQLPKNSNPKKQISLTFGEPKIFGSGHFERCKSLSIELQIFGYDIKCNSTQKKDFDGYIVDARETKPNGKPALAIDNFSTEEDDLTNIYFLPHPAIPELNQNEFSFYSSPLIEFFRKKSAEPGNWLVYVGSLDKENCDILDEYLIQILNNRWGVKKWIRIGGSIPESNSIEHYSRITKYEYYHFLSKSEGIISYFGQSIMEAIYMNRKAVLFGMTEIHKLLGEFFSKMANVIYLGELSNLKHEIKNPEPSSLTLKRDAQFKILKWLETL